jgi:hypothetical protein
VLYQHNGLAGIKGSQLMPVELLLKARLRISSPPKGTQGYFKFSAATCADCERQSGTEPFDDPKTALDHVQLLSRSEPRLLFSVARHFRPRIER